MKIVSAKNLGKMQVYDLGLTHSDHSFLLSNGIVSSNCAYVISDEPIGNWIPLTTVGGVRVTQFDAPGVESSGGLKMDFLVINSLKDINAAIRLVQDRHGNGIDWSEGRMSSKDRGDRPVPGIKLNGKFVPNIRCVTFNGQYHDIWDLPEDQAVFRDICEGNTESVFQFNTPGARKWLHHFNVVKKNEKGVVYKSLSSIEDLATFTALDRPGGLDVFVDNEQGGKHNMLVEFAKRAQGEKPCGDPELIPILQELLPETYGVIVYQEQLTRIYQTLGQTTGAEADEFRVHISKKQMAKVIKDKEVFMPGATQRLGETVANKLWENMEAWARYGFNKSHAVCYVVITYASAWLKHYYPLEWWTAVLRNAERNEINEKFWVHCGKYIDLPDISKPTDKFEIVGNRIQAPFWLLKGIGDKAQTQLVAGAPYSSVEDLCRKITQWRIDNGTVVMREKKNKKTGEVTTTPSLRLATTAINSKVVSTLIVAGTLDKLFPEIEIEVEGETKRFQRTPAQKLAMFEETEAAVLMEMAQKKKTKSKKKVDLRNLDPLTQYQMVKEILPAISTSLTHFAVESLGTKVTTTGQMKAIHHKPAWRSSYNDYPLVDHPQVAENVLHSPTGEIIFGLAGYVTSERRWKIQTGPAIELVLDFEGVEVRAPKWPEKGVLPTPFDTPLTGAVVVCLYRKKGTKLRIEDLLVVKGPLDSKLQEASPDSEDENDTK